MKDFCFGKIIATLGPSTKPEVTLNSLREYVDIFRLNISWTDFKEYKTHIKHLKKLDQNKNIMLDTQGNKIYTLNTSLVDIKSKQKIILTNENTNKKDHLKINYDISKIQKNKIINIGNDCQLKVIGENKNQQLKCKILKGGEINPKSHIDIDQNALNISKLSDKDKDFIKHGVENGVNIIALSLVQNEKDITQLKIFLEKINAKDIKIFAKIETKQAISNIDSIIQKSDGIIIARGDLGDSLGSDNLPTQQIKIIQKSNKYGKPVILSTQILENMIQNPTPTRAETDQIVLNMLNGVDGFMLSKETSKGKYPVQATTKLHQIIKANQSSISTNFKYEDIHISPDNEINEYIVYNAYNISKQLDIKAILCPTENGYTPAKLACLKPDAPIFCFTNKNSLFQYLNTLRGTQTYKINNTFDYDKIKQIGKEMIRMQFKGNINVNDKILIVHSQKKENIANLIKGIEIYKFSDL